MTPRGARGDPARRHGRGVAALRLLVRAVRNYIGHQSANQAGSVAFSWVLSMFPLLIFVAAAAAYVGHPGAAAELAHRAVHLAPQTVLDALQPVIDQVLAQRNRALLAVGLIVTVWTASSGMQAIRTALNRAYGVEHSLSFWAARIKVTVFTVLGTLATVLVFSSVVILPYIWRLLERNAPADVVWMRDAVRYAFGFAAVTVLYGACYAWLPDLKQRWRTVLPGALVGALLWLGAVAVLSYALRSVGKLALIYGGFAGMVATLVFLYASAVTLIFGAEINGVLRPHAEAHDGETGRR